MSNTIKKQTRALARPVTSNAYQVGYGKPPAETRFTKGKSGNPKGRPKGAKNKIPALNEERLKTIILEEAYRTIPASDGDKTVSVPMAQAVMRSVAVNAAKGNPRAQRLFTQLLATTEAANRSLYDEWLETTITYKVEWERELDRRERLGITGLPEPLPHPDHVVIDLRQGTANIRGPATKEEKAEWDWWQERKQLFKEELTDLNAELESAPAGRRKSIRAEIERTKKVLSIIGKALGETE